MPVTTIRWRKNKVELVDQTLLPRRFKYIYCGNITSLWHAIRTMKVRGAPAIGIAGALGVLLVSENSGAKGLKRFKSEVLDGIKYLASSRPTARNLFWALERMQDIVISGKGKDLDETKNAIRKEAFRVIKDD